VTAAVVLAAAMAGKLLGADTFAEYPAIEVSTAAPTAGLAALIAFSGLAPYRA
jgi:hypothetical protein